MNPVVQLVVERGQHLTTAEMFMNAGIVILVVFVVLLLMYILISISGKIIQAITSTGKKKEEPKAEPAKPTAKTYEMRLQMSDNQVARDHSSAIFKRLEEYGYQMASDIVFGQIPKAKSDDKDAPGNKYS